MPARAIETRLIDRIAMAVSGLCVVHCLATAVLLGTISGLGGILGSPHVHEAGLVIAIILGVIALGRGIAAHGRFLPSSVAGLGIGMMMGALNLAHGAGETVATMIGVILLASGHLLNRGEVA